MENKQLFTSTFLVGGVQGKERPTFIQSFVGFGLLKAEVISELNSRHISASCLSTLGKVLKSYNFVEEQRWLNYRTSRFQSKW